MRLHLKRHHLFLILAAATLALNSCGKDPLSFDSSLLVGKWVAGTEYYRYDADGNGATWDVADDVHEEEAQPFTWEYNDENIRLTLIHQMEMGGVVPKSYTILALDATTLQYKDGYDRIYTFSHVN